MNKDHYAIIACEQALHLEESREVTREQHAKGGASVSAPRCSLAGYAIKNKINRTQKLMLFKAWRASLGLPCLPFRRGLFVLWGDWGERKRERAGHDVPRALPIFSIIAIFIGIPRLSYSPSLLISGSVS